MREQPATQARPAAIAFILITIVLDVLAFGAIVPVLPKLIESFHAGDTARAAQTYGLFATAWGLMQFLASPFLGVLSDRFGRRPVLLLSLLGLGLDYILMACAPTIGWLFVGRLISGATAATYATAAAYITDVTPSAKRAAAFGYVGAAWGAGFIFGPALGGVLGQFGLRLPFWVAAGLTLLNALYGWRVLPESLAPPMRQHFAWRRANPLGALIFVRSHRGLIGLLGVQMLNTIAHYSLPSVFVLYAGYRYGWGTATVGGTLAFVGICTAVVQAGVVGPGVRRLGERRAVLWGLLSSVAAYAVYGLAPSGAWFLLGVPLGALAGIYGGAAQSLMTQQVGAGDQGMLQGASSSVMGLVGLIGPGLFTYCFAEAIGPQAIFSGALPGTPFLVAALLTASSFLLALRVAHPRAAHVR